MRRPAGVLLDLDGTLYEDADLIPGAVPALARIRAAGIPVRFVTNTTRMPRRLLRDRLRGFGIAAELDDVLSAPAAAAAWLRAAGVRRLALYVADASEEDFGGFARDAERPEAVVVGDLGAAWSLERMNRAFRQLLAGARLVALQRNRYWKTAGGLSLDAGPFVAALEYAAGVEATLVGKPSRAFFDIAVTSLGVPASDVVMVGDDPVSDVGGAQDAGCLAVLVRTGKYRPGDDLPAGRPPDAVVDSVADLPVLLGL